MSKKLRETLAALGLPESTIDTHESQVDDVNRAVNANKLIARVGGQPGQRIKVRFASGAAPKSRPQTFADIAAKTLSEQRQGRGQSIQRQSTAFEVIAAATLSKRGQK